MRDNIPFAFEYCEEICEQTGDIGVDASEGADEKGYRASPSTVLFPNGNGSTYEPISSVWESSDGELLEAIFRFYATIPPEPILDSTYNAGRFWKGSKRRVVSMDIDPQYQPMIVGDNREMTGVPSGEFGVVIYDPPHVGPQGRDKSSKRFDVDFGATMECGKDQDWNLSYLYPPFLKQAKRVLKPTASCSRRSPTW